MGPSDLRTAADEWDADRQSLVDVAAERDTLKLLNDALTRQVDDLTAKLAEYAGTPVSSMLVGASTPKSVPWDALVARAGPLDIRHHYWQSPPWDWASAQQDVGRNATIGSVKVPGSTGDITSSLRPFLTAVPTDHTFFLIVYHEPEDEIEGGQFTAARYIGWQTQARVIVDELNATREVPLKFGGTLMSYSTTAGSGRDIDTYRPPDGTWDFVGWDGYDRQSHLKGVSEPLASIMSQPVGNQFPKGGCLETNLRWQLPFLVIETGTPSTNPDRVAWITAALDWCRSIGAVSFTYWNNDLFSTWQLDTDDEYRALGAGARAQTA